MYRCEYSDYIKQIESIPAQPSPEVLGLNMNAGITRDLDISKTFFDSLGNMQVCYIRVVSVYISLCVLMLRAIHFPISVENVISVFVALEAFALALSLRLYVWLGTWIRLTRYAL